MSRAVYPGTFDPVTYGHLDVIRRGAEIFDQLVVSVAGSSVKSALFSVEERMAMMKELTADLPNVRVSSFDCLLIHHLRDLDMRIILRGIRTVGDFEYELQMALTNRNLDHRIETVFVMSSEKYSFVRSSTIKEAVRLGGDVGDLVPPIVAEALNRKLRK
jgi:pantetheine-phosphate adenylyltransferase